MKTFNQEEDSHYPTFTFCFKGARFRWFHDLEIFDAYGLNATQYERMIRGEKAEKYVRNDLFRSYDKKSVILNHSVNTDFHSAHPKLANFLISLHFAAEKQEFETQEDKGTTKQPIMVVSYLTSDKICFSRDSNDIPNSVRIYDLISFNSSVIQLYEETEFEVFVHYPNQLLSSFGKSKYSISFQHLIAILKDTSPKVLGLKLTECKRLKKRHNSRKPCNRNIKNYDHFLIQKIGERLKQDVGCIPNYFKTMLTYTIDVKDCTSPRELKEANDRIKDTKAILSENDIPCDEMMILTIDSIINHPTFIPEDISIQFFYTERIYEEIKYLRAIGFENWLSNVGGFVGIFLGYSMMQLPEFLFLFAKSSKTDIKKYLAGTFYYQHFTDPIL